MKGMTRAAVAMALLLAACTPSPTVEVAAPDDVDPAALVNAQLDTFDSCDALLAHIKAEAQDRVGPYGLDTSGYPWIWFGDEALSAETTAAMTDDVASGQEPVFAAAEGGDGEADRAGLGSDEYTGTNTQESDVDEPDILKTDGQRILTITDGKLTYIDISGAEPVKRDSLQLGEGWSHELFFAGDRALVISNGAAFPEDVASSRVAGDAIMPVFADAAVVHEIDLSDPDALSITSTLSLQGGYLSARAVGDTVRLALNSPPVELGFVYPSNENGEDRATEFNREVIAESTIDDWVPHYVLESDGTSSSGRVLDCDRVFRPADFSGFDVVSVLTLDLSSGLDIGNGTGVLASGQTVYASTDRFYVATTEWIEPDVTEEEDIVRWSENYTTNLHAFDNTGEEAEYVASGEVKGSLLNQFSLDESGGYLRVVTTDGSPWDEQNVSETFLTVFEEKGDRLEQVGQVGGLGKGEALYSARLLDDVAFAVTFRQIDPLYVIDLSDPTDPTVSGELKIPGVSTYLHPIGDDRLLGVGRDATEDGQVLGFKISLFSVADPANPVELANWTVDNAESSAEYDHRAFQWLPEQGIAVLPLRSWNSDFNGAYLLQIGESSITEVGQITHKAGDTPVSECTELTEDDFTSEGSELYWMTKEGYGRVQVCGPDQATGYGGFYCDTIPMRDLENWAVSESETDALVERFGEDAILEMCWPDDGGWQQQIMRSTLIGDVLWTMSNSTLQGNVLEGLDPVGAVPLG